MCAQDCGGEGGAGYLHHPPAGRGRRLYPPPGQRGGEEARQGADPPRHAHVPGQSRDELRLALLICDVPVCAGHACFRWAAACVSIDAAIGASLMHTTCWPGTLLQALRIAVNDEIVKLEQASRGAHACPAQGAV